MFFFILIVCTSFYVSFFFFFNDTATTEIYTLSYSTLFRSRRSRSSVRRTPDRSSRPCRAPTSAVSARSEGHTSELQSLAYLVCRLLLEKKKISREKTCCRKKKKINKEKKEKM